jgi:hypothetical protein
VNKLFVFLLAACSAFYWSAPAAADVLSSKYDPAAYAEGIVTSGSLRIAESASLNDEVARIAQRLSQVKGSTGKTIYPEGTVVDRAEIAGGWLDVWITFPEGVKRYSLERFLTYQGSAVLSRLFAGPQDLLGVRIHARAYGETEYVGIDAFIEDAAPRKPSIDLDNNYEPNGPGPQPDPDYEKWYDQLRREQSQQGAETRNVPGQASSSTSGMQMGALTGRIIFTYGGHGRTWDGTLNTWRWQRGFYNNILEDFGNMDAMDPFVAYCFNAGATVVPLRPTGYQNNEVIVDNTSSGFSVTGTWSNSSGGTNGRWYGSGTPAYRFADTANSESATATFTPNIPSAGYYPVYTWANAGSDRVPGQLYRIKSTGGESQVRIDHRRVGCGWVYLGTYYFNSGSHSATGSVTVSNLNPPSVPAGSYVAIADAIRFGNGMGDVNNGGGISGYSRREESTVYWIQNGWGNGDTADANITWNNANTADDENQSWQAPPRMASQMYRVHSDTTAAAKKYALYLAFHSNGDSSTARGCVGLITSDSTPNQTWWATKVADEIDAASLEEDANWEYTWNDRASSTYTDGYGEISNAYFDVPNGDDVAEMDATIVEVAYHDNVSDAALMRDPKVRNIHGRAAYHAVVQYFNHFQAGPLAYLPEPPTRFRAKNNGSGGVSLNWQAGPTGGKKGQAATSYRVYQSSDGLGFNGGTSVAGTSYNVTGLTAGQTYYFRVAGVNAGGESFPTDTLAVRVRASGTPKVLIVDGYDRLDRFNNTVRAGLAGTAEQLILERNNSYNYVRQHAAAIANYGLSFDSCDNESVISGDISLASYEVLVWIAGEESSADNTFNATERTAVTSFLNAGGKKMFVSGAEIGYELDGQAVSPSFYNNQLAADYGGDDGGSYQVTGVSGTILAGITLSFSPGATVYDADYPDKLNAFGGSVVAANYTGGGSGGAAIQFNGGSPNRKIVNLGFPFECIGLASSQNAVMAAAMSYFGVTEAGSAVADWQMY